ncbi:helix-hairpin-helix domain-containing protein [Acholeplasma hippikon]|uniref:ComE operon protein 1 n=1 Tax=Acholeplasma hippikon TaxID=264636 RepID=A0A449BJE3_9MOLU|nr:ComEA family DNA-binding protein [Acholeplasma hippikon]VEU82585.1 ComE operon protein 1 [Acholeplasma hippikon]
MKKHRFYILLFLFICIMIYFYPKETKKEIIPLESKEISVYIDGAVNFPGTYILQGNNKTLGYLIHLAGGLTPYANIESLDLKSIVAKEKYTIPEYEKKLVEKVVKLNLNTASYDELIKIPYISETKALDILIYRKEHTSFRSLDELINISGIGEKTLEKLKVYLTL